MSVQFDMHSDQDEGYSSFSETDEEEQNAKTHVSAAWLSQMGAAAAYQPWPPNIKGPGTHPWLHDSRHDVSVLPGPKPILFASICHCMAQGWRLHDVSFYTALSVCTLNVCQC